MNFVKVCLRTQNIEASTATTGGLRPCVHLSSRASSRGAGAPNPERSEAESKGRVKGSRFAHLLQNVPAVLAPGLVALVLALLLANPALAQAPEAGAAKDEYQRSSEIYSMKMVAKSGPERGETIYYYKCWICHNQYAKTGPPLADLYKRPKLGLSGDPVNDQTVADKIRTGGPAMPSYRYSLSDADMSDLLSYIREGKCCFSSQEPPANPRYSAR